MIIVTDRIVQYPRRFKLVPVDGQENVYDFEPFNGVVTSEGTPINKEVFQQFNNSKYQIETSLENSINQLHVKNFITQDNEKTSADGKIYMESFPVGYFSVFKIKGNSQYPNWADIYAPQDGIYLIFFSYEKFTDQTKGYAGICDCVKSEYGQKIYTGTDYTTAITGLAFRVS